MKLILYSLILFMGIILFRNWYIKNILKDRMKPIHNKLIEMLPITIKYLDEEGIKWILYGGNLLGMYRHKNSFIPWDDDIDLAIFKEDDTLEDRLKRVNEKLKNYKMHLKDTPFGYAIHNDDENSIPGNKAYIDLFIYEKRGNIWLDNEWSQNEFPNDYFKDEMLSIVAFTSLMPGYNDMVNSLLGNVDFMEAFMTIIKSVGVYSMLNHFKSK